MGSYLEIARQVVGQLQRDTPRQDQYEGLRLDGPVDVWEAGEAIEPLSPCPHCGSLELWETLAGSWRCQHCEVAALQRSRDLAERAVRLRAAAPPRTAVQACAGGVSGPRVDTLDLGADRAGTGHLRGPGKV
jgi:hypothetical protein